MLRTNLVGMWRDPMCLARSDWFCENLMISLQNILQCYIRAAPLVIKQLRSCFKHPRNLFPEWQRFSYVYCNCFTSQVSVDREKHVLSLPMFIHWYGRLQNMRCSYPNDSYHVKMVFKTFKSAFMLLLFQKEQHSLFNHTFCLIEC